MNIVLADHGILDTRGTDKEFWMIDNFNITSD